MSMRLPSIELDFWRLVSGEARHAEAPASFWIPPLAARQGLQIGQAAKLIFEIESENERGEAERDTERMWVVVAELAPPYFIGRLTNQPAAVAGDTAFYLKMDVEVPFLPEHVIDIGQPPEAFVRLLFSEVPKEAWPRGDRPGNVIEPA